jgi:hypothetical protein
VLLSGGDMSARFNCHRCGHPLQAVEGYEGKFVRCPKCGSYTSLPDAEPAEGYGCAEKFKTCPLCDKELPAKAVLCNGCGYNYKTGRRVNTHPSFKPFYRHWGANIPLRLASAGVLVLLCVPVMLLAERTAALAALCAWPVFLVFSAGTFRTASLSRDRRGRCDLLTRQWVAFVPMPGRTILLDRHCMTVVADLEGGGATAWVEALLDNTHRLRIILVPGVALFYLYAMLAVGKFALTLADDRGSRVERTVIYRCRSEDRMREVADTLCEVAGLSYS